jgi:hypothetical protein
MIENAFIMEPNAREVHAVEYLAGLDKQLAEAQEALKPRLEKIPNGWRDFRLAVTRTEKVLDAVYETLPAKTLKHMEKLSLHGEVVIRPRPMIKMPDDVQIVQTEDLRMLINSTMAAECAICVKDHREQKKCRLRKALSVMAPANILSSDGLCPYTNVAANCEYGQYI